MSLIENIRGLMARLAGNTSSAGASMPEIEELLDGSHAVATLELLVCDSACLRAGADGSGAAFAAMADDHRNLFGRASRVVRDPRRPIASALAEAAGGARVAVFADSVGLLDEQATLRRAVARCLPLVVHLASRTTGASGEAHGSGHEAYHAVADSGALLFYATDAQEAVDLAMIAHHVAEVALVPVVVAIDAYDTGSLWQPVRLPSLALLQRYLGRPNEPIETPTAAQGLLFGPQRRRIPRWIDLDQPALVGAPLDRRVAPLAQAAARLYRATHIPQQLDQAVTLWRELTGRDLSPVQCSGDDDALAVVAQGATVAALRWATQRHGTDRHHRLRAIGLRCLRPFPTEALGAALRGAKQVVVLERAESPLGGEPPLSREVRASLTHQLQRAHGLKRLPEISTLLYGLGGEPLAAGDLDAMVAARELPALGYLGLAATPGRCDFPKRQALLDTVARAYPNTLPELRGSGDRITLGEGLGWGVVRRGGADASAAAETIARLLQATVGGGYMCPAQSWDEQLATVVDRGWSGSRAQPVAFVADAAIEVALITNDTLQAIPPSIDRAAVLLLESTEPVELPAALAANVAAGKVSVYRMDPDRSERQSAAPTAVEARVARPWLLAGAMLRAMREAGRFEPDWRQLQRAAETVIAQSLTEPERGYASSALARGFDRVVGASEVAPAAAATRAPLPTLVQAIGEAEQAAAPFASLTQFHATTTALYANAAEHALTADPLLQPGVMPPLSAAFATAARPHAIPALDSTACTGCGKCWVTCPDGAIGALAVSPRALLEHGVARAGQAATGLRRHLGRLANRAAEIVRDQGEHQLTAEVLFSNELTAVTGDDSTAKAGGTALLAALEGPAFVRSEALFDDADAKKSGSGELLLLAINAEACKGCELCIDACEPNALRMVSTDEQQTAKAAQAWALWQALPDTPGTTISRLVQEGSLPALAAITLSRHSAVTMVGSDAVEAGSPAKIALRATLAVAEYERQRFHHELLRELTPLRDQIATRVREALAGALPASDLAALGDGLEQLRDSTVSLTSLSQRLEQVVESQRLDVKRLRQLTEAGRALADVQWQLERGTLGLGRARLALALAPVAALRGLVRFPFNPLLQPTWIDRRENIGAVARGLVDALAAQMLPAFRALRRARLELSNPTEAAMQEEALAALGLEDLTTDERRWLPPLLLVGGDELLATEELYDLLDGPLPIKVLVLSDGLGAHLPQQATTVAPASELTLLAHGRRAYVAQSSLAHPNHLFRVLSAAVRNSHTALLRVEAPHLGDSGLPADAGLRHAAAAVTSRLAPLLALDPQAEGVLGTRLDLSENPAPEATWDEKGTTPAHLLLETATSLPALAASTTLAPLALVDMLRLPEADRLRHLPTIDDSAGAQHLVPPALAGFCAERARSWRMLQELAGQVTPFTQTVRLDAEREVAEQHKSALAALRAEHEHMLAQLRSQYDEETVARLTTVLTTLAMSGAATQEPS